MTSRVAPLAAIAPMRRSNRGRAEVRHEHVQPFAFDQVVGNAARPARQPSRRAPDQPGDPGPVPLPIAHRPRDFARMLLLALGPLAQPRIPVGQPRNRRSLDHDTQIGPTVALGRSEIVIGNVETAEHGTGAIGDDKFLVVADEIASRPLGRKAQADSARIGQRAQELIAYGRAELVDDQRYPYPRFAAAASASRNSVPTVSSAKM